MLKVSVSLCQIELSCLGAGYSPFPGFVSSSAKMRLLSQATNSNDSDKVLTEPPSIHSRETKCSMKTVSGIETAVETLAFKI